MNEELVLVEFGDLVSTYETYVDAKKMCYLNYNDYKKNIKLEVECISIKKGNYRVYCKNDGIDCEAYIKSNDTLGSDFTITDYITNMFHIGEYPAIISCNKTIYSPFNKIPYKVIQKENNFTIIRKFGDKDIEFTFDDDKMVFMSDYKMKVFWCADFVIRPDGIYSALSDYLPLEIYDFNNSGFSSIDLTQKDAPLTTAFVNNKYYEFGALSNESFYSSSRMFGVNAAYLDTIGEDDFYDADYSRNGITNSIIKDKVQYCRWEYVQDSGLRTNMDDSNIIPFSGYEASVHPIIFNPFDFEYVDPDKYWAEDKVTYSDGLVIMRRNIYDVSKHDTDKLLEKVNSKVYTPIIYVYED